jgi:hypothetical protein
MLDRKKDEMANFTIYRGSWRRGGDTSGQVELFGNTLLLNEFKMMCCLGQCAFQLGVPLKELLDQGEPAEIGYKATLEDEALIRESDYESGVISNGPFANAAMPINDDARINDQSREVQLISLGKNYGHTITFVDGVAPWFAEQSA